MGQSGGVLGTVEGVSQQPAPVTGTFKTMYIAHLVATVTDTMAYTLRINGVDTSITATMASSGSAVNDTAHTAAFVAGDLISIKAIQSGSTASTTVRMRATLGYTPP
jgi:hypothetical protein